jgi:hypothetical protein
MCGSEFLARPAEINGISNRGHTPVFPKLLSEAYFQFRENGENRCLTPVLTKKPRRIDRRGI